MKIIGIDPGYAIVGWGVVDYNNSKFSVVDYGSITTGSKLEFSQRLLNIYNSLNEILNCYRPVEMAVEKLFFNSNHKTAIDVAQARGVVLLAAKQNGLNFFEYTPLQIKQSITGYGRASKAQVIEMAVRFLNLKAAPKPDDTADALAVAVTHAHFSFSKLFNLKGIKIKNDI